MFLKFLLSILIFAVAVHAKNQQKDGQDWWKHATFYQIYPRSFKDANNDGIGDLAGVLENFEHLVDTGVDGVWLSPIMQSPQVDQGYDISDYTAIDPIFGTMDDLKLLIEKAHESGLKVIMDFVPNHTSDKHEWFIASENKLQGMKTTIFGWMVPQTNLQTTG
ncbi:hypothetical protein WA026_006123 [Henosepilachna vigintioctopunctata]|uniref:Glycosyl hydrolase family 13 catalytic domain-containing protein n=1 Tax=Henosepilachna vigintioctopunctata TaxID=420089 RepID=A0AAW1TMZ2_9CUCU